MAKYRSFLSVLVLFAVCPAAYGQNLYRIEQLHRMYRVAQSDSARVGILLDLGFEYDQNTPKEALNYYEQARKLSQSTDNKSGLCRANYNIGAIYQFDFIDYTKALEYYEQSSQIAYEINDWSTLSMIFYHKGVMMAEQNDTQNVERFLLESIRTSRQAGDGQTLAMASILLGENTRDDLKRLMNYEAALHAIEEFKTEDPLTYLQASRKVAEVQEKLGNMDQAKVWNQRAIECFRKDSASLIEDDYAVNMVSESWIALGMHRKAIDLILLRLQAYSKHSDHSNWYKGNLLSNLATAYNSIQKNDSAYIYMKQSAEAESKTYRKLANQNFQRFAMGLQSESELRRKDRELMSAQTRSLFTQSLLYGVLMIALLLGYGSWRLYISKQRETEQKKRLEDLHRTKNKILSILSHDLRSPLKALQNIIYLANENLANGDDVKAVGRQVGASIINLQNNLDSLLIWAQNQQNELRAVPKSVDLNTVINDLILQTKDWVDEKKIRINFNDSQKSFAFADPIHAKLATQNILTNAIKFSAFGGEIDINTDVDTESKYAIISIINKGTELNIHDVNMIFDPSVRYTRIGTANEPGSGLGLTLTKELMQLNHGYIQLQKLADGSTLTILGFPCHAHALNQHLNIP
jgi:two-component system, sensor histidine kinase and response regulator